MNIKYHKELCIIRNFGVFDFELSNEDIKEISKLDEQSSLFFSHYEPETVEQFKVWGGRK